MALFAVAALAMTAQAWAQPLPASGWRPQAWFVEAGRSQRDTRIVGLGLRWPWQWQGWGGRLHAATELSASDWLSKDAQARWRHTGQVALVPLLRWRPDEGRSPWFVEGGVGLSLHSRRFEAEDARMSTIWNFYDVLALGHSVGATHEWSLRAVHVSNGGARNPNPGSNILMLRWTTYF